MNAFIRLLYALLVAGAVVAFAGLAIYSFYQPPKYPSSPAYPQAPVATNYYSQEYAQQQKQYQDESDRLQRMYDKEVANYKKKERAYQHNVTVTLLPMAVIAAGVGIYLMRRRRSEVLGEGLALGGVGISIYAIITASLADARVLRFVAASLLLVIVLLVAHFRFVVARDKPPRPHLPL